MIILATGANAGFGRVIAQRFAGTGARFIATGRREARLATPQAELGAEALRWCATWPAGQALGPLSVHKN